MLAEFPDSVLSQSPPIFGDCEAWDVAKVDGVHEPAESEVPVLLLAGELDAITAPSRADEAASTLSNSTVVRFPGAGHDGRVEPDGPIEVAHPQTDVEGPHPRRANER